MYKGIDISVWQCDPKTMGTKQLRTAVDFAKLRTAADFVMIRTGYGRNSNQRDTLVEQHARGCAAAGIPFGYYHYSYADSPARAEAEADFMLSIVESIGINPEYPLAIDFECSNTISRLTAQQASAVCNAFCARLLARGYYPMVYANLSTINKKLTGVTEYDFWVAHWAKSCGYKGDRLGIWQYADSGKVAGVPGDVDHDIAYIDYPARIRALGLNGFKIQPSTPPSPPTDEPADVPGDADGLLFPAASQVKQVQDSSLYVGDAELPTLIVNGVMYAPVRAAVRLIGSRSMGVVWDSSAGTARVALGEGDDADEQYDALLGEDKP